MATRSDLSPPAAIGIWVGALIGSWTMALAVLGSINGAVIGCESGAAMPEGPEVGDWIVLLIGSLVPVLVMAAVTPAEQRTRLIGLAAMTAAVGLVVAATWIGPCL